MSVLTKRRLKAKITKRSVVELLSLLDIQHVKSVVSIGQQEDLIDIAYLVQHQHERAATKFAQLIKDKRVTLFFNAVDCPIPLGEMVESIMLEDIVVCKVLKSV